MSKQHQHTEHYFVVVGIVDEEGNISFDIDGGTAQAVLPDGWVWTGDEWIHPSEKWLLERDNAIIKALANKFGVEVKV
jgi:hypothetical protein